MLAVDGVSKSGRTGGRVYLANLNTNINIDVETGGGSVALHLDKLIIIAGKV